MSAGDELPSRMFGPVSRTDIVRYQGASGDFNPIHHDEDVARSVGLPGVIGIGMLQAGYLATYVAELFGAESVRELAVRFREPVWPGDTLTCGGRVVERDADRLSLELAVTRDSGAVAVAGRAVVVSARDRDARA